MKKPVVIILLTFFFHPLLSQTEDIELKAINAAVESVYSAISFDANKKADTNILRAVFTEDAFLKSYRGGELQRFEIGSYIDGYDEMLKSGSFEAIIEKEIWGKTEYFGKIAHRISTYELYYNDTENRAEIGVNSFQLVKMDGKWRVSSVIFDVETDQLKIPTQYLGKND